MDESTQATLDRGRRVREILKQPQYDTRTVAEQLLILLATNAGLLDNVAVEQISTVESKLIRMTERETDAFEKLGRGEKLNDADRDQLLADMKSIIDTTLSDEIREV